MEEPRVFILSEWAKRVEDKLDGIDDKIDDHDHKQYVMTVTMVKAVGIIVATGISVAAIILS